LKKGILIIGCGEIGTCLIDGWLNKKQEFFRNINQINVIENNKKRINYLKKNIPTKFFFWKIKKVFFLQKNLNMFF
jgi:pyrroline-5-carboxylate reductase